MSDVITKTIWNVLDVSWVESEPDVDVLAITVTANGKNYAVTCAGHKGMLSTEFIPAMRAATAILIKAVGGDMGVVGVGTMDSDAAVFDTGNQRPS